MAIATDSGRVVAGPRLAAGGQGEIFAVTSAPGLLFKKYRPEALASDPALERRLRVMVTRRPAQWREPGSGHMTLAWPTDVVVEDGRFAGFLMPAVDTGHTVGLHRVTNPSDRHTAAGAASWTRGFTWRYLVRTAANLARATAVLHEAGVVIGDFNESNVRVWHEARVTLLDCDSMQIRDPVSGERFFCRVGRPEFTPPELHGADWATTVRQPSSDLFALAIHLYQLLLEGEHPFRGVWRGAGDKPPVSELAGRGVWAQQGNGLLTPRRAAIGAAGLLPEAILDLFREAFEDGAADPDARPTAAAWHEALDALAGDLRPCGANPAHSYPVSQEACPWCQYTPPPPVPAVPRPRARAGPAGRAGRGPQLARPAGVPAPGPRRARSARGAGPGLAAAIVVAAGGVTAGIAASGSGSPAAPSGPRPAHTLNDPGFGVHGVAFSPDGKLLATGDLLGDTLLWNVATRHNIATLATASTTALSEVDAVAFSPDGKILATGDDRGHTYLWDVATRRKITELTDPDSGPEYSVAALAFSPDGKTLATGDDNGRAFLWNVATGSNTATLTDPGAGTGDGGVAALAFSPDGETLATGDANGSTYLWHLATDRVAITLADSQSVDALAFSPDGAKLAAGLANDGGIDLWNVDTGINLATIDARDSLPSANGLDSVDAVAFSPDGSTLATGDSLGDTYLRNPGTGHITATLTDPGTGAFGVTSLAFSPDGSTLATGDSNSSVYLWNLRSLARRPGHPATRRAGLSSFRQGGQH